jgi:hypothetical protein
MNINVKLVHSVLIRFAAIDLCFTKLTSRSHETYILWDKSCGTHVVGYDAAKGTFSCAGPTDDGCKAMLHLPLYIPYTTGSEIQYLIPRDLFLLSLVSHFCHRLISSLYVRTSRVVASAEKLNWDHEREFDWRCRGFTRLNLYAYLYFACTLLVVKTEFSPPPSRKVCWTNRHLYKSVNIYLNE